jgi:multidrug efflux system outer membrane protein
MKADPVTRRGAAWTRALLPAALIAGCTVGPDYQKPEVTAPTEFRSQPAAQDASSLADQPWWNVFNDKALQSLISEALHNNQDLQVAVARIEQARAMVGIINSQNKPQLDYRAVGGGEKTFVPGPGGGADTAKFASVGGMLDAAWELDIWGRIRRSSEAARANLMAQQEVRNGVLLTLTSDVAASYFHLLELDRELVIAQQSADVFKQTFDLFDRRFEAGRDSKLPVERAGANYAASNAKVEGLRREIAQQENALSVLLGGYPRAITRGRPLQEQTTPATPVGATTALVQRRPDIRQAEQNMIAANAEIGVAVANYFPRIGLSALAGALAVDFDGGDGSFGVWNIALSAAGPIFTGGRLKEVYNSRRAFWDETVAQYRKTTLVAFRETSDALVAQQTLVDRRAALEKQVANLNESSRLALLRYGAGRASYFEVLEAQQQLFPAEDELAQTQQDQLVAVVSLYKALGGGWNLTPEQWLYAGAGEGR